MKPGIIVKLLEDGTEKILASCDSADHLRKRLDCYGEPGDENDPGLVKPCVVVRETSSFLSEHELNG